MEFLVFQSTTTNEVQAWGDSCSILGVLSSFPLPLYLVSRFSFRGVWPLSLSLTPASDGRIWRGAFQYSVPKIKEWLSIERVGQAMPYSNFSMSSKACSWHAVFTDSVRNVTKVNLTLKSIRLGFSIWSYPPFLMEFFLHCLYSRYSLYRVVEFAPWLTGGLCLGWMPFLPPLVTFLGFEPTTHCAQIMHSNH